MCSHEEQYKHFYGRILTMIKLLVRLFLGLFLIMITPEGHQIAWGMNDQQNQKLPQYLFYLEILDKSYMMTDEFAKLYQNHKGLKQLLDNEFEEYIKAPPISGESFKVLINSIRLKINNLYGLNLPTEKVNIEIIIPSNQNTEIISQQNNVSSHNNQEIERTNHENYENNEWEYATLPINIIQFYNTYLRGQDLPYDELSSLRKTELELQFNNWKTEPQHMIQFPLSSKEEKIKAKAKSLDNIVINIAGGVALGLPIAGNKHVFLKTESLIACNALVITGGGYTFLAHVVSQDAKKVTERCIKYFIKHTAAQENDIHVYSYYVQNNEGKGSEEVLNLIKQTIGEEFPSISLNFHPKPINTGNVMIDITGQQLFNDVTTYDLGFQFEESSISRNNIRTMKNEFKTRNNRTQLNLQEMREIELIDHRQSMIRVLDRLYNLKNNQNLGIKGPWLVTTG